MRRLQLIAVVFELSLTGLALAGEAPNGRKGDRKFNVRSGQDAE